MKLIHIKNDGLVAVAVLRGGGGAPSVKIWPTASPSEIFGKCNWRHGVKKLVIIC